jgi:hypothetical protein
MVLFFQTSGNFLPEMTQEEALSLATETLSEKTKVSEDRIHLLRADPVQWPDTSLGCPQRNESYLHLVTPGFAIILFAEGMIYQVNVGGGLAVVCGEGVRLSRHVTPKRGVVTLEPPAAISDPTDPKLKDLVNQAKDDLAERLEIPTDSIDLLEAQEVTWPDSSLGCPKPGLSYMQVLQEGARIRLRAEGRTYHYHSGADGAPFYCENPSEPVPKRN